MSSKIGRFFYLTVSFILGLFFLAVGLFSLILPWSPFLQTQTIHLILNQTLIFSLFGLGLTLIGLSILIYAFLRSKRRYASIRTGHLAVTLDEALIQQYLDHYWRERFPNRDVHSHLTIKKNALYITADLPFVSQADQGLFLEEVRHDFQDIFGRLLGYPHDVHLAASFQPEDSL